MEGGAGTGQPLGVALFRTIETIQPEDAAEEAAYSKWLDQTSAREEARLDRLHGAEGIIPGPVWVVLFLCAAVIFVFMLLFADREERRFVQAVQIGAWCGVGSMFVVLGVLDDPYQGGPGRSSQSPWSAPSP